MSTKGGYKGPGSRVSFSAQGGWDLAKGSNFFCLTDLTCEPVAQGLDIEGPGSHVSFSAQGGWDLVQGSNLFCLTDLTCEPVPRGWVYVLQLLPLPFELCFLPFVFAMSICGSTSISFLHISNNFICFVN